MHCYCIWMYFFKQICVVNKNWYDQECFIYFWSLQRFFMEFGAWWYVMTFALLFCKISINGSGLPSWHCYSYCKVTPRRRLYCKAYVALAPHWRQGLFSCTHPLSRFSAILLSVATSWQHQQALGTGGIQNRDKYALTRQKRKLYLS